jgi:hypothetical protein
MSPALSCAASPRLMSSRGRSRGRARRVTLSTEFEQAAELGRSQAYRSESPWEGRLRFTTAGQAQGPTQKAAARRKRSWSPVTRSLRPKVEGRKTEIKEEGRDRWKPRQVEERQARIKRGTAKADTKRRERRVPHRREQAAGLRPEVALVQCTKQSLTAGTSRVETQTRVTARRASSFVEIEEEVDIEEEVEIAQEPRGLEGLDDEIPDMAEGELGPYAVVEEAQNGGWDGQGEKAKEDGNKRRSSNTAVRYGQKPEMSPKTPGSSRGGQQTDNLKDNGEKGKESGHKEDVGVRSPETVVKQPVGSRSIVESPGGKGADAAAAITSPSSLKALKATFEMGVQAELQARRAETARQIEEDKERMMAHEVNSRLESPHGQLRSLCGSLERCLSNDGLSSKV